MQRPGIVVATALIGALVGGCAVLTQPQVDAVADFADATKDFGTTPSAVIQAHGQLRRERGLLEAASRTDAQVAVGDIERSLRMESELDKIALRTSVALDVLDEYAEMLGVLSSSRFTDDLQERAVALGKSIDADIATFNKLGGANVGSFGDVVAGIVRGAGGIWIRHEQERALKAAVTSAQAPVRDLTRAVETLMQDYLAADKVDAFGSEAAHLESIMKRPTSHGWGVDGLTRYQNALALSRSGEALARSCQDSARHYREAHEQLVAAITGGGKDLQGTIASIKALAAEVQAGKRVRNEVKEARGS